MQYSNFLLLETGGWKLLSNAQQNEFLKTIEKEKIPFPISKARYESELRILKGKDSNNRILGTLKVNEFYEWEQTQRKLNDLKESSWDWRQHRKGRTAESIQEEKQRRIKIAKMEGKTAGRYSGDPLWDDVKPIPQDDGENALAAIAYTEEYAEGKYDTYTPYR